MVCATSFIILPTLLLHVMILSPLEIILVVREDFREAVALHPMTLPSVTEFSSKDVRRETPMY